MSTKKLSPTRRTLLKGTAATAAIAPFFIGKSAKAKGEPDGELTLKLATVAPAGTPWEQQAKSFQKLAEKQTGGRLKIKRYLGGALGDEVSTVEACKAGRIAIWAGSCGAASKVVPALEALEMPYLYKNEKAAQKAIVANRQIIHDQLWDAGFKLLMFAENGFRSTGTTFPVEKPSDLKGRKIRTQETKSHIALFKAWNASPTPMGTTEVLSALQTGVIEGFDNTPLFTLAAAWYMGITHFVETQHIYQPGIVMMSRKGGWDKLGSELQEGLQLESDEVLKIEDRGFRRVRALKNQIMQNFVDLGIEIHKPDLTPWREAADAVHADFLKRTTKQGKALFEAVRKAT